MTKLISPVENFITRYHVVIGITIFALGTAAIIFINYNSYITSTTVDETITDNSVPISFDNDTAEKIDKLEPSTNIAEPTLPEGRINPFIE